MAERSPALSFRNQARWDRLLRVALGASMLTAGLWVVPEGLLGAVLRVFGLIPLVTGLLGWSPLYAILGWSTLHRRRGHRTGS